MCANVSRAPGYPSSNKGLQPLCYNGLASSESVLTFGRIGHCGSGGTGRHTILRGWRRKAWGFKSPLPHHLAPGKALRRKQERTRPWPLLPDMVVGLITVIHIVVCLFLIIVVLLQSGKSADIAAAFGGMGSQTAFGPRGGATVLSKATTWAAVIFMVTSITLSIFASRRSGSSSVLGNIKQPPAKTAPQTPPANTPTPNPTTPTPPASR